MIDPVSPFPDSTSNDSVDGGQPPTNSSGSVDDPTLIPSAKPSSSSGAATTQREATGRTLGPYELLELLGQGGMGAVYKARHKKLDKLVALKLLTSDFMKSAQSVARFEREMKAVGKITHPNIVQAHDAGEIDGTHYLAMELVEGTDLYKLVKKRGLFSVKDACQAVREAALGLHAAHKVGLVHRDIKPSNLLQSQSGQIKILDLGLARIGDDDTPHEAITSSGQVLGTPDYMAPEQWEDTHTADLRTDLYALGCTLFFLLTGRAPFATDDYKSVVKKMAAHVNAPIPDLKAIRPEVPDGVDAIYRRLMSKQPEDRYSSAAELAQALSPFLESGFPDTSTVALERPQPAPLIAAARPPESAFAGSSANVTTTMHAGASDLSPSHRNRSRWLAGLASGIVALLLGVILVNFTKKNDGTPEVAVTYDVKKAEIATTEKSAKGWHGWPIDAPAPAIAPFNATQAKKHQEVWAAYLTVPVEYTNSLSMKFRLIPPGEFMMGSSPQEIEDALKAAGEDKFWEECIESEGPQHKVILTQAVYLGVHEVTQKVYAAVMGTNPSHFSSTGAGKETVANLDTQNHPVEMVSWNDAAEFCEKLSSLEMLKPVYFRAGETVTQLDGTGYRFPTEAEFEFACRAGTLTKYWIGDNDEDLHRAAWIGANSGNRTHAVGELKSNPFGLFDVNGNVWEPIGDWWNSTFYGKFSVQLAVDPTGPPTGQDRVFRSSGWSSSSGFGTSALRGHNSPTFREKACGFRVALSVDAVRQALKHSIMK